MTRANFTYGDTSFAALPAITKRATMRRPTPLDVQLAYWTATTNRGAVQSRDAQAHLRSRDMEAPECGFYRTRFVKDGPHVPVRIWLDQEIDPETGELLADEVMRAEVDGHEIQRAHDYLASRFTSFRPILESAYRALIEERRRPDRQGDIFRASRAPIDLSREPILP